MAEIVVLGAGLGGVLMAYEMKDELGASDNLTVISNAPKFHFVPSNPWVAVDWRKREAIEVDLAPVFKARGINFIPVGAKRVEPAGNRIELEGGQSIAYDLLIIATGPELAFDEIEGLGPHGGHTQSICVVDHAEKANGVWSEFVKNPGPIVVGAVQGASCFGPAYEFAFIMETDLRRKRIRDKVPMTFVTPEPYIGHLGLDGVGDTKSMIESAMRDRHIKWITNAKVVKVEAGKMHVEELHESGETKAVHELPFSYSMMLPAFRGVPAVRDIEGLGNPRGFIIVDEHQRNPTFPNIFAIGVCIAIPPVGKTALPVGVPKTGFMIESMVTAAAKNVALALKGKDPVHEATWSAVCLADFGDDGIAFIAQPQIPPRNVNWSSTGKWVHVAKIGFEKYFLGKIRRGKSEPFYEKLMLRTLGLHKLKDLEKT